MRKWLAELYYNLRLAGAALRDLVSLRTTTNELVRLNDSLASVMLHYQIPRYTRAELSTTPPPLEIYDTDEAKDAFEEWRAEYEQFVSASNTNHDPSEGEWPEYSQTSTDPSIPVYDASLLYGHPKYDPDEPDESEED